MDNEYFRFVKGFFLSCSYVDLEGNFEIYVDLGMFMSLLKLLLWRLLMLNCLEWYFGLLGSFGVVIVGCEFFFVVFVIG